jgi:restriction system protein
MAMGYGGADGAATRTQLSNDGGVDGIIDQDALRLSRIYVQAKRYAADNVVDRQDIQAFVGALAGNLANQGVFIATSSFSTGAAEYARAVPTRVILIDRPRLATMIRFGVGVQVVRTVQIIELDEDFFE